VEHAEQMLHLVTMVLAATRQLPDHSLLEPPSLSEVCESQWRANAATSLWLKIERSFYPADGSAWDASTTRESHATLTAALHMPRARFLLARLLLVSESDWLAHEAPESIVAEGAPVIAPHNHPSHSRLQSPITTTQSQPVRSQPSSSLVAATSLILMRVRCVISLCGRSGASSACEVLGGIAAAAAM
jgi:hypothetical protein